MLDKNSKINVEYKNKNMKIVSYGLIYSRERQCFHICDM